MNELLRTMARDMGIDFYYDESPESYAYRIIYSGLGLWCLHMAASLRGEVEGRSKKGLTRALNGRLKDFLAIDFDVSDELKRYLVHSSSLNLGQFIRNVYEEAGYLSNLDQSRNGLNRGGETVEIREDLHLYLGLPQEAYTMSGLGVYCKDAGNSIFLYDLLIRDDLSPEDLLRAHYNPLDFDATPPEDPLFFDVESHEKIAQAWSEKLRGNMGIAKSPEEGRYYRVIRSPKGKLFYAATPHTDAGANRMSGCEYRRLYLALKKHLKAPVTAECEKLDSLYTCLRIHGEIPNREYYFLLLSGWPKGGFSDTREFILKNDCVPICVSMLKNIGIVFDD